MRNRPARLYVDSVRALKIVADSRGVTVADVVDELLAPLAHDATPAAIHQLQELRKKYQ